MKNSCHAEIKTYRVYGIILIFSFLAFGHVFSQSPGLSADQELGRSIFKELIEINTTHSSGNTTLAAEAMAKRFLDAGFDKKDMVITGPKDRNKNLVIRLHGLGKAKPILFIAHLDVVEALKSDWSFDPFQLTEKDGYFYGRGTMDIKDGVAILVADFIRLKKEEVIPDRDLILALTAGEESGEDYNGVEWLLKEHRDLIDAAFCLNPDAGDPQMKNGRKLNRTVQASEKGVLNFTMEVSNPGGHSSEPSKDNAIYRLADGLTKLGRFDFPVQMNEVTRAYFGKMASLETGQLADDMKAISQNSTDTGVVHRLSAIPYYNALMRTTCVATMLEGGHAINALPQTAKAYVNCRVMPGTTDEYVLSTIKELLNDGQIHITATHKLKDNPASPLTPSLVQTIEKVTRQFWPGVMLLPVMEVGATDGIYLRSADIPTYGISGVFLDVDDNRAHGKDERIGVREFYEGLEYYYLLIKAFGALH